MLQGIFSDLNVLFTDIYDNQYFFDKKVLGVLSLAQAAFLYESEENIRDMGCLEWHGTEEHTWRYDPETGEDIEVVETGYLLYTKNMNSAGYMRQWAYIITDDPQSPEAKRLVENAIDIQLREYRAIQNNLGGMEGLYYMVSDGDRVLTNLAEKRGADFFREQPVFLIKEIGSGFESSRQNLYRSNINNYDYDDRLSVYIAYSQDSVNAQNNAWSGEQLNLSLHLALIIGAGLAFFLLLVILMVGAGRHYGSADIYLTAPDKLWLDVSLAALVGYEAVICYGFYALADIAWRYESIQRILALCGILAVLFTLPLAWWVVSFCKRCKAGKWWRHTAVYALPHGLFGRLRRFAASLWAGRSLTTRVAALGLALFLGTVLCAAPDSPEIAIFFCALITALAVFGLLRYARKLHLVEQGAREAGNGKYAGPITVAGGELGSIAASINNISDGINAAVAEQLKSERLKTELITNISHDIRTPLTSLITYSDLLKNEGLDNAKAPEYLDILIQKSARLKTLTDDLFEASKAASGNVETHIENLDLADLVRQVLGELDERVRDSGLDFRQNLPDRAPVSADGKLLWRVMENLLSNVFKYAAPGSRVYIDVAPEGEAYRLDIKNISDRPLNIDPSELAERFKRGDSARSGEGSGLGLSIAQSFTQAQGGRFALAIDGDLFKVSVILPAGESPADSHGASGMPRPTTINT